MQVMLLVGIFSGVFTATEAAAVSVVYAIAVEVLVFRAIGWLAVFDIARDRAISTGVIFILLAVGALLAYFITLAVAASTLNRSMEAVVAGIWPFIVTNVVVLILISYIAPLSTFLPKIFGV